MDTELLEILREIKDMKKVTISYFTRTHSISFVEGNKIYAKLLENGYINCEGAVCAQKVHEAIREVEDEGIKIIFLDVDGVLNCSSTKDKCGYYIGIEDKKVSLLKEIVNATNAKIVLVSSWKESWYKEQFFKSHQDILANYLDSKLNEQGLTIFDKTEDEIDNRGDGILEYVRHLKWKGVKVDNYIVIDDELFDYLKTKLTKNLIQTSFNSGGLQEKHVKKAIGKLNRQQI